MHEMFISRAKDIIDRQEAFVNTNQKLYCQIRIMAQYESGNFFEIVSV